MLLVQPAAQREQVERVRASGARRVIAAAMAFDPDYRVLARAKRDKVRLYGNAVTPPVAEIIGSALVEAITGEPLEVAQ
jgi:DNA (cytosine-5)-methyltransferase 1